MSSLGDGIAVMLGACERQLGVSITVVDHHGLFHDQHHRPIIGADWQSHRSCQACDIGFGPRCIAHCRWQVGERLSKRPQAYLTRCWKGLREIACPLRWNEHHLGTLFAGTWRQQSLPAGATELPKEWRRHWQSLPVLEEHETSDLLAVLSLLSQGLAERLGAAALQAHAGNNLKRTIATFVRLNGHLPIDLADLAEHLQRSVSRTGVIVREQFSMPFARLLRRHRIRSARHLLRHGHLRIADIAQAVGYEDPLYFSRMFRREVGVSPKAYRHQAGS